MNNIYKHDLYKELYYNELDLKDKITSRVNFAFGVVLAFSSVTIYIIDQLLVYVQNSNCVIYWISLCLVSVSFIASAFMLFRSYFGYSYDYIPSATKIENNLIEFEQYYEDYKAYFEYISKEKSKVINDSLKNNIKDLYCECSDKNRNENFKKTQWLRRFGWSICILLIVLLLSYIVLILAKNKTEVINTIIFIRR